MFCYTNECDADKGFLRTDDNRARSLVTIAVQRCDVGPSIKQYKCNSFKRQFSYYILSSQGNKIQVNFLTKQTIEGA